MNKKLHKIYFNGALLERGFWLYVWKIVHGKDIYFYVGRTGDTSSPNASSPFRRMGMHFDLKPHAKANCVIKHLRQKSINPFNCTYKFFAYGPIFPEQKDMDEHRIYRDRIAALEAELAYNIMSELRCCILGTHPKRKKVDTDIFAELWSKFKEELS